MTHSESLALNLLGEMFQTERSAIRHCAAEADRLGDVAAARALRAVVLHATRAERELEALAQARNKTESAVGKAVGSWFSVMRDGLADFALDAEQSYRATLLGMRHGYDLIDLFAAAADAEGDRELATWASEWLRTRQPLLDDCARELGWFARNPDVALRSAKGG